jgi:hypothetical protein
MSWTVAQVVSTFRDLTGRKSSNQISDADILIRVNHYFQYIFPGEAQIREFMGWYTFNTVDGTGVQAIPDAVTELTYPAYVDDEEVTFWTDEARFYQEYPHDYTTEDTPSDILLIDRNLILRPIPDDEYEARLRKISSTPDALTTGDLDNSLWGPAIAFGSSIMFLMDKGEKEVAEEHGTGYQYHLSTIRNQVIRQQPIGRRPAGGRF